MELTLDQALQKGIEAHKAGKLQEADRYYTAILQAQPKHPDANHHMGVLAVGVGKVEAALPFFKTALEANSSIAQYWLSYIDALIKLERLVDAKVVFDQAKNNGAKGDAFDDLEQRLVSSGNTQSDAQDPPQNQIQPLVNFYRQGQYQEAFNQASQLLLEFPRSVTLYNIIGAANTGLGKLEEAIEAYKKAIDLKPDYADAFNNLGLAFQAQGKLDKAIDAYTKALSIKPNYAEANYNMGNALKDQGQLEEAIEAYNKALAIKPDYADAYYNMGVTLQEQGKLEEAIEAFNKALAIKPDNAEAYNNMGNALKEQGNLEEAIEAYNKALAIKPDYADTYYNMGVTLQEQGKLEEAIEAYNKVLAIKPDYADAYYNMGNALKAQGNLEEAIEAYTKAISIKPDFAEAHHNIGITFQNQGELDTAIEAFKKAISIKPDFPDTYNNMGVALITQGKLDGAIEAYKKALSIKPNYAEAHRNLSLIKKYTEDDEHFLQVRKVSKRKNLSENGECQLSFALAKIYEDLGELDQSYSHLSKGNALRKKLLKYSINQDQELFTKLKNAQPHLLKNALKMNEKSIEAKPFFILGMPRSGTTLVEQIISLHSEVLGAGELSYVENFGLNLSMDPTALKASAISEFRERYKAAISKLSNGKQFITDKMPQNFRFIPLICAAFPEAKIIHVKRTATATCWSNYRQYFKSKGLGYCYDLKDVVEYYKLYKDLMKFWQSEYSGRIYNLSYEKLVNEQEKETRKLIEYLDLTWEKALLLPHKNKRIVKTASQQQVRQKVYKGSSETWRKYEVLLNGAFDSLPSS